MSLQMSESSSSSKIVTLLRQAPDQALELDEEEMLENVFETDIKYECNEAYHRNYYPN